MGFLAPIQEFTQANTLTATLPTSITNGDDVYVALNTIGGTGFTPPAGYAIVGAVATPLGNCFAIYKHSWATGDATSAAFTSVGGGTSPGNMCWIIRADAAASIVTDQTSLNGASTNALFKAFTPTTAAADLRMAFLISSSAAAPVAPAVTASDANPSKQTFMLLGTKIPSSGSTEPLWIYQSLWSDPSGYDANNSNFALGSSLTSYTRSMVFNDGTQVNGLSKTGEVIFYQIDPNPTAISISDEVVGPLSAAAGRFGGGAHLLG